MAADAAPCPAHSIVIPSIVPDEISLRDETAEIAKAVTARES